MKICFVRVSQTTRMLQTLVSLEVSQSSVFGRAVERCPLIIFPAFEKCSSVLQHFFTDLPSFL